MSVYGHAANILAALDNTPCTYCGKKVGREARGSKQCKPCILFQIELEAAGFSDEQTDRILELHGKVNGNPWPS